MHDDGKTNTEKISLFVCLPQYIKRNWQKFDVIHYNVFSRREYYDIDQISWAYIQAMM